MLPLSLLGKVLGLTQQCVNTHTVSSTDIAQRAIGTQF